MCVFMHGRCDILCVFMHIRSDMNDIIDIKKEQRRQPLLSCCLIYASYQSNSKKGGNGGEGGEGRGRFAR